jgi:hypothetical protein
MLIPIPDGFYEIIGARDVARYAMILNFSVQFLQALLTMQPLPTLGSIPSF